MTDILLTHSFFVHFDPKQAKAQMPYPPLGTLYAARYLQVHGFTVDLFDTMLASSEEELQHALDRFNPRLLAIYDDDFNYLTKMCLTRMREAAFRMTAIAKAYGIPVVVHGSDAADHYEKYLLHGADVVVIGEGEQTLVEVCRTLLKQTTESMHAIRGIAFNSDDNIVVTEKRPVTQQLDLLPFPAWDLVEWEKYNKVWKQKHGYVSVNMVTTRGCPYHCNWCAKPIYGQVYNSRSPENVVEEMAYLKTTLNPDHIWFADDIFGLKPGWVQRFSHLVNERNVKIPFKIQSRADLLLRGNTIEVLANAGCSEVWIGAESGSQKILDAMEKGITLQQIYDARKLLKQYGINVSFFLQFGYRGETWEDIQATIAMVKELMPEDIGISVSYPLPGTKFFDMVKAEMGEKKNWTDSDDLAMMYRGTYPPRFYKLLHRYVHKVFRIRRALYLLREALAFRRALTKNSMRRIVLLAYYIPVMLVERMRLYRLARR